MNFICEHPPSKIEVETGKYGLRQAPPSARPVECGSLDPSTCENGEICVCCMLSSIINKIKTITATDNYDLPKLTSDQVEYRYA